MATITERENGKWQAKVRRSGWPTESRTFRTKKDAEAWARATEREMDVGGFISSNDAEKTTFTSVSLRYRNEVLPKKKGGVQDSYVLNKVTEVFGDYSLAAITPPLLCKYRDERLEVVAAQTVVHELNMISRVFNTAILDWEIAVPKGNPVVQIRKPVVRNNRSRRLEESASVDEEALLMEALNECESIWPHAVAVLAIETAARQSELISMKWAEVDLDRRVARLRGTDGGTTKPGEEYRDIPLSRAAVALLKSLPRCEDGSVFPISQNALQLSWVRAKTRARKRYVHSLLCSRLTSLNISKEEQAKEMRALVYKKRPPSPLTLEILREIEQKDRTLLDLRFHDLRHEATSRIADKLQMHELMKVTGHASSRMLSRYYHPKMEVLAEKLG